MAPRYLVLGLALAVVTFLLAGGVTIEILSTWSGDGPGVGILDVSVGVVVGVLAGVVVTFIGGQLSSLLAAILVGYGAFGVAFLVIAGLDYVNVHGADEVFSPRSPRGRFRRRGRGCPPHQS